MVAGLWVCVLLGAAAYESTVVASRPEVESDSAADSSVIDDTRTPRAGEDLPQLLAQLPGVSVARLGGIGAPALVSLRGSAWDQVSIFLDGILLNSALGGGVDVSAIPLGDVASVQVYRGVSPTFLGASNIGGVVAITTRAPERTSLRAGAGAGSFGTYTADAQGTWDKQVYMGVHGIAARGDFPYTSDNGTPLDPDAYVTLLRTNNALSSISGTLRVQNEGWRMGAWVFAREQGLPGYGVRPTRTAQQTTQRVLGYVAHDVGFQLSVSREQQSYSDPHGEITGIPTFTHDGALMVSLHGQHVFPLDTFSISTAADLRWEQVQLHDVLHNTSAPDSSRFFGSISTELDIVTEWAKVHVSPVLRLEFTQDLRHGRNDYSQFNAVTDSVTQFLPIARLAFRKHWPLGPTVRANVSRYARVPSLTELFGDSGFVLGNPQLLPEIGDNVDLGMSWSTPWLNASCTAFASRVYNLIQYEQNAYGQARPINIGEARIVGAESTLTLRPIDWLTWLLQATFMDARDISPTALGVLSPLLPLRPQLSAYTRLEARYKASGVFSDFTAITGNALDPANLVFLPPRLLWNIGIFATYGPVSARFTAQNILNNQTMDFAGFPLPGRSFFAALSYAIPGEQDP